MENQVNEDTAQGHKPCDIELKGTASLEHRIAFMTTLLNNAESKVNHIDSLRQRSLMIALGIFAGLIGFAPPVENSLMTFLVPVALLLIIILFWYVDHLLHKYSEGWQTTLITLAFKLGELINKPTQNVTFPRYDKGRERAKPYGPSARVYIFLAFGAVAFAVLRGLTKWFNL